jgi:hypothetical protein
MDQHSTASSLHMCNCPSLPPTSANNILFLFQPQSLDPTKKKKTKNFMCYNNSGTKNQNRSSGEWPLPKSDDLHQILYRIKSAAQHGASYIDSRFFFSHSSCAFFGSRRKLQKRATTNEKKFERRKVSVPRSQAQTDSIECSLGRELVTQCGTNLFESSTANFVFVTQNTLSLSLSLSHTHTRKKL